MHDFWITCMQGYSVYGWGRLLTSIVKILIRVKMATLQGGDTASVSSQSLEQFRDESKRKSARIYSYRYSYAPIVKQ